MLFISNTLTIFAGRDNIRYDLMRTGNVEVTTNKIIERGYLDAVRASFRSPQ